MSLNINSFSNGIFGYGSSNAKMSPQEKMMYELFGGEQAYMRNVMKMYNSDGDYVGAYGSTVP